MAGLREADMMEFQVSFSETILLGMVVLDRDVALLWEPDIEISVNLDVINYQQVGFYNPQNRKP